MSQIQSAIEAAREHFLAELSDFLRIPSISTLSEHGGAVRAPPLGRLSSCASRA